MPYEIRHNSVLFLLKLMPLKLILPWLHKPCYKYGWITSVLAAIGISIFDDVNKCSESVRFLSPDHRISRIHPISREIFKMAVSCPRLESPFGTKYSRMDSVKLFKACFPQNFLSSLLNALAHLERRTQQRFRSNE